MGIVVGLESLRHAVAGLRELFAACRFREGEERVLQSLLFLVIYSPLIAERELFTVSWAWTALNDRVWCTKLLRWVFVNFRKLRV